MTPRAGAGRLTRVLTRAFALAAAVAAGALLDAAPAGSFFPVAVWYSGGTARAPMLSPIGPGSEAAWRDGPGGHQVARLQHRPHVGRVERGRSRGRASTASASSTSC